MGTRILLFGATGMVGQGVLRECLLDPEVEQVLSVGRSPLQQQHEKLREIVHGDLFDLSAIEPQLAGYDACCFCLGVTSAGMSERDYRRTTYDLTLAVANTLVRLSPQMVFIYVSGAGTDSSERTRSMWARVKGETENALFRLPFKRSVAFRPAFIQPQHGIVSKTRLYRALYAISAPLYPMWKALFPKYVTTTENVGRAMVAVAKGRMAEAIVENRDIDEIARG